MTHFAILLVAGVSLGLTVYPERPNDQKTFERMAEYLSRGSGKWRADNPNHDPANERSPKAFGLWFDWVLEKRLLEIRIVGYVGDTTYVSSQGIWAWHPGKEQIIYINLGWSGYYAEGTTHFTDETTFVTVTDEVLPDGSKGGHKDENFILSEDVHSNVSYRLSDQDIWERQGEWTWHRLPEEDTRD